MGLDFNVINSDVIKYSLTSITNEILRKFETRDNAPVILVSIEN